MLYILLFPEVQGISCTPVFIYSTTNETHHSLLGAILEIRIKKCKYMYTIVLYNQFCINALHNLKVLLKSVQAVRQCLDKGSLLKMTSFY